MHETAAKDDSFEEEKQTASEIEDPTSQQDETYFDNRKIPL